MKKWKMLSTKKLFSHPRLTLYEDKILLPSGKKIDYLKFEDNGSFIVTLLCKRDDGKFLVQEEVSYPYNKVVKQLPGGGVAKDEGREEGANRELVEESNFKANKLELLGKHLQYNRRSSMMDYIYLATDLVETKGKPEYQEEIKNIWMTEEEIDKAIVDGEDIEGNMLCAWAMYKCRK